MIPKIMETYCELTCVFQIVMLCLHYNKTELNT